jgi:hypothetical protein
MPAAALYQGRKIINAQCVEFARGKLCRLKFCSRNVTIGINLASNTHTNTKFLAETHILTKHNDSLLQIGNAHIKKKLLSAQWSKRLFSFVNQQSHLAVSKKKPHVLRVSVISTRCSRWCEIKLIFLLCSFLQQRESFQYKHRKINDPASLKFAHLRQISGALVILTLYDGFLQVSCAIKCRK